MIKISYDDFQTYCPVAQSPTDTVFRSIKDAIEDAVEVIEDDVIGEGFMSEVAGNTKLIRHAKKYVCNTALLRTMAQKDVVLTATGFGVVSNDNVAPASTARVNEVRANLEVMARKGRDGVIRQMCSVEDWADSDYAKREIQSVLWQFDDIVPTPQCEENMTEYRRRMTLQKKGQTDMEQFIGEEIVEHVIACVRRNALGDYSEIYHAMVRFLQSVMDGEKSDYLLRDIKAKLERNLEKYDVYNESRQRKADLVERYSNNKKDCAFFF